jgi:ATP-binding cassette subfamily B protein
MSLFNIFNSNRRYFIPEIIQTSAMDCGPATLKAVLEGYHISASYERLREICQTDVSGTSINTIEDIACDLGLDAEQVIIQKDHLLLSETDALPAIVVVRLPDGYGHFVVVWRMHGQMIQIMDPAIGRLWITQQKLFDTLYPFTQSVDIHIWEDYSKSDIFCLPLTKRMSNLNIPMSKINHLINHAKQNDWQYMATLDAAVRILHTIVHSRSFFTDKDSEKILTTYYELALNDPSKQIIPKEYFSVLPDVIERNSVLMKGVLLIRIAGKSDEKDTIDASDATYLDEIATHQEKTHKTISNRVKEAIHDTSNYPEKEFYDQVLSENKGWPLILLIALALAALNVSIEALFFMGFIELDFSSGIHQQPITMFKILIFFVALLCLETPINAAILKLGRRFEISIRMKFLKKTPELGDHYFRSRLNSDMVQRVHDMRMIRNMPEIAGGIYRLIFQIVITIMCIMYLMPVVSFIPVVAGLSAILIPIVSIHFLKEQDLRFRTLTGSLAQFCLDALIGIVPLRSHNAENAIRYNYESILCKWKKSGVTYNLSKLAIIGSGAMINILLAIWLIYVYVSNVGNNNFVLLLIYWVLNLSESGGQLANMTGMYPNIRNRVSRILEPIHTKTETLANEVSESIFENEDEGLKIVINHVSVIAADRKILKDIHLNIQSGEHLAIVGSSGAGKSSLMRLLLGFYHADSGEIFVDNNLLSSNIHSLRRHTAWIDPCVHIWNRSFADNIKYGTENDNDSRYEMIIEQAELIEVLNSLPYGNETRLGEGGGLVSGGEGQRVRLGRGMYKNNVRLVILDEPFRGLSRTQKNQLLKKALDYWHDKTLIFISHDVQDTINFDRVLVMENGKIIEDSSPNNLLSKQNARYRAIIENEKTVQKSIIEKAKWKKWWIEDGKLTQEPTVVTS